MITGELKNKIDSLWNIFWTGGLTNPLDVIEQITYLMFIKDLDDLDDTHSQEAQMLGIPFKSFFDGEYQSGNITYKTTDFKWSNFVTFEPQKMFDTINYGVFPFIKNLHSDAEGAYSKYMADAIFKIPNAQKLVQIVDSLNKIYEDFKNVKDTDVRGDVYEYLLSKLSTAGTNGQFRTPRHIIRMMVELMDPQADDVICDPSCGSAGFLVAAGDYLKETKKKEIFYNKEKIEHYNNRMFTGYDMDRTMLRIGAMNMMTHGVQNPRIEYKDSLSDQNEDSEKFTLILANPPFKGSIDADIIADSLLKAASTKKTELLFVLLFLRSLRIGGRCASIVPDGVLFGSTKAHKEIRRKLVEENKLIGVISMPSGVFKPYAGVSTAILIFIKTGAGGTDNVWFYDMKADGYSLDDKRSPIEDNDIPDIISRFKNMDKEKERERTDSSFLVPKQEIVDNDYDLSINKYKKTVYVEEKYLPSKEILAEIKNLHQKLGKELDVLEKMLND